MYTTNYYDTFIEIAEDCPVDIAEKPPLKTNKTVASIEYEMIADNPYKYTSDEVLFEVFVLRNDVPERNRKMEIERFFSKGQACFRGSPLTKRYGWGVHFDSEGKMAIYAVESDMYRKFVKDKNIGHVKAMRSKRA